MTADLAYGVFTELVLQNVAMKPGDNVRMGEIRSVPGYAFFYNVDTKGIAILGSMQDALHSFPSHVNDVITVSAATRFQLRHQNGDSVEGVFLETYDEAARSPDNPSVPSINHVFARLIVERLADRGPR